MYLLWTIGIICFSVNVAFGNQITYSCNDGVQCLPLESCTGLYREWHGEHKQDLEKNLITGLLCAHKQTIIDKTTKVCCPADVFLSKTPFKPRVSEATRNSTKTATTTTINPNVTSFTFTSVNLGGPSIDSITKSSNRTFYANLGCGISNVDRIYGGEMTAMDEYPWMVLLGYNNGKQTEYFCGGVLISSIHILTAAHCIKSSSLKDWTLTHVRLGEWKLSENPDCSEFCNNVTDVGIADKIAHESFKQDDVNFHNDIALVKLSQTVEFTDYVRPICLPTDANLLNNSFEGNDLYVAGWGKTENSSSSDIKLQVSVRVANQTECVGKYKAQARSVTSKQLCAGGVAGKDSCKGDSGGSLMRQGEAGNWTAVGVVSYGPTPCGSQGWPGVYTRVTSYIDWLQSKMKL